MNGLIAVLLAAEVLSAQPASFGAQEAGRALQLLNSPQWVDKAWGAYLAGRLHSGDLDQRLIEEFRLAAPLGDSESGTEEHAYVTVLFDAAIEAGITVPAALLEPFQEHWIAPVVILLARDKESEDLLLQLSAENSREISCAAPAFLVWTPLCSRISRRIPVCRAVASGVREGTSWHRRRRHPRLRQRKADGGSARAAGTKRSPASFRKSTDLRACG